MIKIFSSNQTIFLTETKLKNTNPSAIVLEIDSEEELVKQFKNYENDKNIKEIYFVNASERFLLDSFSSMYEIINAAGGVVKNNNNELLLIFRNGKWDLPKGKVEKNEIINDAAIREVEEECGVSKLKIIQPLPSTYHTYELNGSFILKQTYWFLMHCDDTSTLIPQLEEGITEVQWMKPNNLKPVFDNTYESIKEVLISAGIKG